MKVSVIIPCYNERKNLPRLINALASADTGGCETEYVLIDNGSADGTAEFLAENTDGTSVRTVTVPVNHGYGYGIRQGLLTCLGSDYVGWMHADLQCGIHALEQMLAYLKSAGSTVRGKRLMLKASRMGRPASDRLFTWGQGVVCTALFGIRMRDICATPVLFDAGIFRMLADEYRADMEIREFMALQLPDDFSLDTYMHYHALRLGFREERFPAACRSRQYGQSAWNSGTFRSRVRQSVRICSDCIKIRRGEKVF